jgi:hypothetical protein
MSVSYIPRAFAEWAHNNGAMITSGFVGFDRDCVGLAKNGLWVHYCDFNIDPKSFEIKPHRYEPWEGYVPSLAYHKENLVAVLGQDTTAWSQLFRWISNFIHAGCSIDEYIIHEHSVAYQKIPYIKISTTQYESVEL